MYRAGQKRIAQSALAALSQEAGGLLREMQGMKAAIEYTSEGLEAAADKLAPEAGPAAADSCFAAEQSCDGAPPEQHSRGQQQEQQRQSSQASATEPPILCDSKDSEHHRAMCTATVPQAVLAQSSAHIPHRAHPICRYSRLFCSSSALHQCMMRRVLCPWPGTC